MITPKDFSDIRWRGSWIWAKPVKEGSPFAWDRHSRREAHGLFRQSFDLSKIPNRVPARITADSRYVLYVNGTEVSRGPVRSQPRRLRYDMLDLAPHLKAGRNTIAVHVKYYGTPKSHWIPAVANGTLGKTGVMVFEADLGNHGWLVSDQRWRSILSEAHVLDANDPNVPIVVAGVPVESFDARNAIHDWHAPEFDDGSWGTAHTITPIHIGGRGRAQPPSDPYGAMLPNSLAPLAGETVRPVAAYYRSLSHPPDLSHAGPAARVEKNFLLHRAPFVAGPISAIDGHLHVVLDMGRIVAGFVDFEFLAQAGTKIEMGYFEEHPLKPGPFGAHGGNRYVARGANDRHRVFDKQGFRFAHLVVHGTQGPFELKSFSVQEDLYPWKAGPKFESDNAQLNALYNAGKRTVALNSWDAFIDCPTREQRAWTGDAVVHQMVHLAANADWRLAFHLIELGNSPRSDGILPMSVAGDIEEGEGFTIPDWSLHWVHALHNAMMFGLEREVVKAALPTAERILRWYLPYQNRSGLLQDVAEWNLVDWSSLHSDCASSIINGLWARGLKEFAEIAGWLGEKASAAWAKAAHARVAKSFDLFWDARRGCYVDHIWHGKQIPATNQLAGALAIVSGLAPRSRHKRIINVIADEKRLVTRSWLFPGTNAPPEEAGKRFMAMTRGGLSPDWDVQNEVVRAMPFMSYVVHDAVAAAGRSELLPKMLLSWTRFLHDGYDTFGENWESGTHVHGWSSTPVKDIVFHILGVTPAAPGYEVARVAPRLGALKTLDAAVPTPRGLIKLKLKAGVLSINTPIAVILDLGGKSKRRLKRGKHAIRL